MKLRPHHIEAIRDYNSSNFLSKLVNRFFLRKLYTPQIAEKIDALSKRASEGEEIAIPSDPYESDLCRICPHRRNCQVDNYDVIKEDMRKGLGWIGRFFEPVYGEGRGVSDLDSRSLLNLGLDKNARACHL